MGVTGIGDPPISKGGIAHERRFGNGGSLVPEFGGTLFAGKNLGET